MLEQPKERIMENWITTKSGTRFYFANPTPDMINIEDIAHSLAHTCRFNGHCNKFYSTAQHSILVMKGVHDDLKTMDAKCPYSDPDKNRILKTAFLHDAAEAYIGDMVAPLKWIMPEFKAVEKNIEKVIWEKFDLTKDPRHLALIKKHDIRALATEARDLVQDQGEGWECLNGHAPYPAKISPLNIQNALRYFNSLAKGFGL